MLVVQKSAGRVDSQASKHHSFCNYYGGITSISSFSCNKKLNLCDKFVSQIMWIYCSHVVINPIIMAENMTDHFLTLKVQTVLYNDSQINNICKTDSLVPLLCSGNAFVFCIMLLLIPVNTKGT